MMKRIKVGWPLVKFPKVGCGVQVPLCLDEAEEAMCFDETIY